MFEFDWGGEYRSLASFLNQHGIMFCQSSLQSKRELLKGNIDTLSKRVLFCLPIQVSLLIIGKRPFPLLFTLSTA